MNYPGFVGIGRLGGRDTEGFHHVMIKPEYRSMFSGLDEVYLIFNSDRVFYVSIEKRKQSEKKTWVRFREDGIAAEQKLHKEVVLAIDSTELTEESSELDNLLGFSIVHENQMLGVLENYFFNGAQQVLQIVDSDGIEYLVPYVDHYVSDTIHSAKTLILQNATDLIALYRNEASK